MNYLIKRTGSAIALQLNRSKTLYKPFDCYKRMYFFASSAMRTKNYKSIDVRLEWTQSVWKLTENKRCYSSSVSLLLSSQFLPVIAMLFGRLIQKRLMTGISYIVFQRCSEETPLTRRRRFVICSQKDYESISELLFKVLYNTYKHKLLPNNHSITKRVNGVVTKILQSNQEFDKLAHKKWSIYVIRDPKTANAFVLPTGQIFVYSGIVRMCDNDSQLGAILAHELSHTLLVHGKEMISQEILVDLIKSFVVLLLWIRLNVLKALVGTVISFVGLKTLLLLPKRRLIEMEADFIGLFLMAKTCYDVREGSVFWMKMAAIEDNKWLNKLSTHPSHTTRYEAMDSYMESMIKLMECFDCPKVSETDPRLAFRNQNSDSHRLVFSKKS